MIRVTRLYRFAASHRLHNGALSEEQNRVLYGKCNNPYGHGHNYVLEVQVRGPIDPSTGRGVAPAALDQLVRSEVLEPFDHRNLNTEVAAFAEVVPTTENIAVEVRRRLALKWRETFPRGWPVLDSVRIAETARNLFELTERQ